MEDLRILELFSGIGGMHLAMKESGVKGEVLTAIEINPLANCVYKRNFPNTQLLVKNITSMTIDFVDKLDVNAILMSPPCQPFTRVGNQKDLEDNRCSALQRITEILPCLNKLKFVLVENVWGFESSKARNSLINALEPLYDWREFDLSPRNFGVPNSRRRYYLIAVRRPARFPEWLKPEGSPIRSLLSKETDSTLTIDKILEFDDFHEFYDNYLLKEKDLKRVSLMDIVTKEASSTCCFTKSYGRYAEGTGSVYSPLSGTETQSKLSKAKEFEGDAFVSHVRSLRLRFFTPREIQRLMSFPETFSFPNNLTNRQMYSLLGNSINVKVVSHIIDLLSSCQKD